MSEIRAVQGAGKRPEAKTAHAPRRGPSKRKAQEMAAAAEARAAGLRRLGFGAALGALWVLGGCGGGVSGEIGRACMTGGRSAANPQLCSCIQGVANQSLSIADQRRVARFFADPDEAEGTRASDTLRNDEFWKRYRAFTAQAEAICR